MADVIHLFRPQDHGVDWDPLKGLEDLVEPCEPLVPDEDPKVLLLLEQIRSNAMAVVVQALSAVSGLTLARHASQNQNFLSTDPTLEDGHPHFSLSTSWLAALFFETGKSSGDWYTPEEIGVLTTELRCLEDRLSDWMRGERPMEELIMRRIRHLKVTTFDVTNIPSELAVFQDPKDHV